MTISFYSFFLKKTHSDSASEHSSPLESSGSLDSPLELLGVDVTSSKEQLMGSLKRQPSGKLGEESDQIPQDELGQERRDLEPETEKRRQEETVSYLMEEKEKEFQPEASIPKDSLVATTTKDILFQKRDSASVYPLVSVTWFCVPPGALRVLWKVL